jgi:hypothetical protein
VLDHYDTLFSIKLTVALEFYHTIILEQNQKEETQEARKREVRKERRN